MFQGALTRWERLLPEGNVEEFYVWADLLDKLDVPIALRSPLQDVIYMIGRTLIQALDPKRTDSHVRLVSRVLSKEQTSDVAIVTTNWDLVLENAAASFPGLIFDYGHAHPKDIGIRSWKESPQTVTYLKLHGSFNWLFCLQCQTLWIAPDGEYVLSLLERAGQMECPDCHYDHCRPVVAPPVGEKFSGLPSTTTALAPVWSRTASLLRGCSTLMIAGYSFPRTDLQVRLLMLGSLIRNEGLQEIHIITRPKPDDSKRRFEDRIRKAFGVSALASRLRFEYVPFEEWDGPLEGHTGEPEWK